MWTLIRYLGLWVFFLCLVRCFNMIIWTPAVLSVQYACVSYFCICTCSAQLSMFHMERRSKNTLMVVIIISPKVCWLLNVPATSGVSQGRICSDNCTCCHTEIEVADQTFHLTQSQYTDTGLTSPSTDPISPGAWQGSHWSTNF